MLPVVPQTRVVELAEQVLSTFNGERPSAGTIKAKLYRAGHVDIFEQCYSLGAGDMLGAIEDAIARRYGSKNSSCDTSSENQAAPVSSETGDTGIENQAAPVSNEAGNTGIENQAAPVSNQAGNTGIESQEVPVSNDPGPPILPQQQVTICDSSGAHSSPGAGRCEMRVPRRYGGALRCRNTTDLKQQDGRWLCHIHILPDCSLNEHCQFVTAQPLRCNPHTAGTGRRSREQLQQPVQLTEAMRDYIRQRFGAHAVSARDQFVCRRCSNAISRNISSQPPSYVQAQQSAITVTQMRKHVDTFSDVVRQILTYVLDAQTPLTRRTGPAQQAIHAAHEQALCNYAMGKCPAAVGMDIVEAMQYHMLLAHTTGLADSFFFPDDARPGDDAGPRAASADWYTPQVKQRCKFSETVKLKTAAAAKCLVLAVFCFDGTLIIHATSRSAGSSVVIK